MPADALDDDRDDLPKYYGPGRRRRATGPVIDAYADARMDIDCPDCAAPAWSFCRHPNGNARMTPCRGRGTPPPNATRPQRHPEARTDA